MKLEYKVIFASGGGKKYEIVEYFQNVSSNLGLEREEIAIEYGGIITISGTIKSPNTIHIYNLKRYLETASYVVVEMLNPLWLKQVSENRTNRINDLLQ